jgi:hypothetical protein
MPISHPLITSPFPSLKEKGVPFLLAIYRSAHWGIQEGSRWIQLTVKHLAAVQQFTDVAHADFVPVLDSTTCTDLPVIDGNTLDDLYSGSGLLVSSLGLLSRVGRALLEVLGKLNFLVRLGWLSLLCGDSFTLVVLQLLELLLAQLGLFLGNHVIQALSGILGRSLVLALLSLDKLRSLLLIGIDLLYTLEMLQLVKLITQLIFIVLTENILKSWREIIIIIVLVAVILVVISDDIVSCQVDGMRSRDDEESPLALADGDIDRLLIVLQS